MSKIRAIGIRKELGQFTGFLHESGFAEIREFSQEEIQKELPAQHYSDIVEELIKLEGVLKILPKTGNGKKIADIGYKEAILRAKKLQLAEKFLPLQEQKEKLFEKQDELAEAEKKILAFKKFGFDFSELHSNVAGIIAAKISQKKIAHFRNSLIVQGVVFDSVEKELDKNYFMIIVGFEKEKEETVKNELNNSGAIIESIPQISGTPVQAIEKTRKEMEKAKKELEAIDRKILEFSKKHFTDAAFLAEVLSIERERAEITAKFGRTKELFFLEGFLPARGFLAFKNLVLQKFGGRVFVEELAKKHGAHLEENDVPTLLENPKNLSPFEFMTKFVSVPKSSDLDPTIVFAIVFPIIYGMMLG
ncbi:MAG: hypothetical protein HYW50_00335 [Candidatus Diapherotrites archaeon]|nr:hypothetical protein [Candidatus Diapherotrites archaeon]